MRGRGGSGEKKKKGGVEFFFAAGVMAWLGVSFFPETVVHPPLCAAVTGPADSAPAPRSTREPDEKHSQVPGRHRLGAALARHARRVLAQLLEEELHPARCVCVWCFG